MGNTPDEIEALTLEVSKRAPKIRGMMAANGQAPNVCPYLDPVLIKSWEIGRDVEKTFLWAIRGRLRAGLCAANCGIEAVVVVLGDAVRRPIRAQDSN